MFVIYLFVYTNTYVYIILYAKVINKLSNLMGIFLMPVLDKDLPIY